MNVRQPEQGGSGETQNAIARICKREATKLIQSSRDALRDALLQGGSVFEDLAKRFIPEQHKRSQSISIRTISLAAKLLLDEDEYAEVAAANHEQGSKRGREVSGFDNVDGLLEKAMEANGLTAWETEEDARLEELAQRVVRPQGVNYAGKPDYKNIAAMLNQEFHGGENIRTANGARVEYWKLLDARQKLSEHKREKRKEVPWNNEEEITALLSLVENLRNPEGALNARGRGGPRPGTTNWPEVANQLNQKFHAEALHAGIHTRKPQACLMAARRLKKKSQE